MNPYAFEIGSALAVLIAAVAAWAVLRRPQFMRRSGSYAWHNLPSELRTTLSEFQHSIEESQAAARKAAKISEVIVAAVKPIEVALKDFKNRITELEKHRDENERRSVEFRISLVACQTSLEENARALAGINVGLDGLSKQLIAVTDQLSNLKQATESGIFQQKESSEELRAINRELEGVKVQVAALSQRLDAGETGQARLSALGDSVAK